MMLRGFDVFLSAFHVIEPMSDLVVKLNCNDCILHIFIKITLSKTVLLLFLFLLNPEVQLALSVAVGGWATLCILIISNTFYMNFVV